MTAVISTPPSSPASGVPGVPSISASGRSAGKLGIFAILLESLAVTPKVGLKIAADKGKLIAKPQKPDLEAADLPLPAILTVPVPLPPEQPVAKQPVATPPETAPASLPVVAADAPAATIELPVDVAFTARLTPKADTPVPVIQQVAEPVTLAPVAAFESILTPAPAVNRDEPRQNPPFSWHPAAEIPEVVSPKPMPATAAPAAAIEPEAVREPRAIAPEPLRNVSLRITGAEQAKVDIHVVERGGEIHVGVRTPDADLAHSLRGGLSELGVRLEQSGYHTEIFRPGEAAFGSTDEQRYAGRHEQGQYQERRQNPQDRWDEAFAEE